MLADNEIHVILSDQNMPGMTGSEFLNQVREHYPDTVRMVLSGYADLDSVLDAINRGHIYKFLMKPWDENLLRASIHEAFEHYELGRKGAQFNKIYENTSEGILITDTSGHIQAVNPAFKLITGYGIEDVIGETPAMLKSGRHDTGFYRQMWERLCEEGKWAGEIWNRRKNGDILPEWLNITAIRDSTGSIQQYVGLFTDITAHKQVEEQLRLFNETLEQQVLKKTRQNIDQERLLIEQSRNATMGEMIRNIAHQWRQPLNVVALAVQNIRDDFRELNEEALDKDVDMALRCVMHMSETIDDFRNFFRADKEKTLFSLYAATDESVRLLEATMKNADIQVSSSGDQALQAVGYLNEFSQVMLNLLANATDALVENKVQHGRIAIEVKSNEQSGIVSIRDNAGGIPEEITGKIFDPYFTTKISGSGIGLYMSRIIIEKHMGGRITCCNVADGAEFTVSIPLKPNDVSNLE
jgi:PAS domain S-box-containing protein